MEAVYITLIIGIDVGLQVALASWAARGGTGRVIVGLAAALALILAAVYVISLLYLRRRAIR